MAQQGQVFRLAGRGGDGTRWAYRYQVGGRGSKRVQRGGFESERAAADALERVLERLRRQQGLIESPTLPRMSRQSAGPRHLEETWTLGSNPRGGMH